MTENVVQPVDIGKAGNSYDRRLQKDIEELEALEKARAKEMGEEQEPVGTEDPTPPTNEPDFSPEESTFKKRYGDLRKHAASREQALNEEINNLKEQVRKVSQQQTQSMPIDEEQLNKWMQEFPHLAKAVQAIVIKGQKETYAEFERVSKSLEGMKKEAAKREAYAAVVGAHPELPDIVKDPRYTEWLDEQPQWVRDALMVNETDAPAAIKALNLFKFETGYGRKPKKQTDKEAATSTNGVGTPPVIQDNNVKTIRESEIKKMSDREYARREKEIDAALREGRIIYDISGGAR